MKDRQELRRESAGSFEANGSRSATRAGDPRGFIWQHLSPLFSWLAKGSGKKLGGCAEIGSEEDFWSKAGDIVLRNVRLRSFKISDWFPRAPGVYSSKYARWHREEAEHAASHFDPELGEYYKPQIKMGLIEDGGIGTIRLLPRKIDGEYCWLATALKGVACQAGIPLAIPDALRSKVGVEWGDQVDIEGQVRFLQDAGLDDTAHSVHHARPLIVFVDQIVGVAQESSEPILISPVALFEAADSSSPRSRAQYTFVQCAAGSDSELDAAVEWIGKYVTKYAGRVITNFDQQRPSLADAPLSYQRLVTNTHDRTVIQQFNGTVEAVRINQLIDKSVQCGDVYMGHNINVGGSAIINIDSTMSNVTQTVGSAPGLDSAQKVQLEGMVQSLKAELDKIKASHADESKAIAEALEKAVANAAKPPAERKPSLLQLSAKGLKEAAELVKDTAPAILTTAGLIAKFITGL